MNNTPFMELTLSADNHRVLSANKAAWALVENNVFLPLESFLEEENKALFLRKLTSGDGRWFALSFLNEPDVPFLAQVLPPDESQPSSMIRLLLVRADQILEDSLALNHQLAAAGDMLSLSEDVFFEVQPDTDTVVLFNTASSRYHNGSLPLSAFLEDLQSLCDEQALAALSDFVSHLREQNPRFQVIVPCNLYNQDSTVHATMLKGMLGRREGGQPRIVCVMHPLRTRGAGDAGLLYDPLTGLLVKEQITRLAVNRVDQLQAEGTNLAILDIDYFKHVNDTYGHHFGDLVLRNVASIMKTVIGDQGVLGRIGGDEFMIVFYHVTEQELRAYLRSIKSMVSATFPDRGPQENSPITVTLGSAAYPQDAENYDDLFMLADYCLYLAKEKGRNRYIHYDHVKHPPLEEIRALQNSGNRSLINGRDDLPLGDALAQMQYLVRYGKRPSPAALLTEFTARFRIPLALLWCGEAGGVLCAEGAQKDEAESRAERIALRLTPDELTRLVSPDNTPIHRNGMTIINDVDQRLQQIAPDLRADLLALDVHAFVCCPFVDEAGREASLILLSLHKKVFWNEEHLAYYRLFADTLALYDLNRN